MNPSSGRNAELPLRIALVTPSFPPALGGLETHVGKLAEGLSALGQQVTVFARRNARTLERRGDISVSWFPSLSKHYAAVPSLWIELRQRRRDFDVVHAHSYNALPALAAATVATSTFVFTPHYHGPGHTRFRRLLHLPYKLTGQRIFDRADAVVCVTSRGRSCNFDVPQCRGTSYRGTSYRDTGASHFPTKGSAAGDLCARLA